MTDLWELENEIYSEGYACICGVDEAGRGPLAGPVYAAAVILPKGLEIAGLNNSKKLTAAKRDALFDEIIQKSIAYSIAFSTVEEIETLNILGATMLAMNRAIKGLSVKPELALIDGNRNNGIFMNSRCIVKGDSKCADIAAASVLAKVSRDRYMLEMAEKYPQYHFELHKGYGTKQHYEALREHGPCEISQAEFSEENALIDSRELGEWGEKKAANYLMLHGYRISDTNYSCRHGEIDIIAENRNYIVFAEVKLRKSSDYGEAREFVTYSKQRRIIKAAQLYLQQHDTEKQPRFDVLELYWKDSAFGRKAKINHIENAFEV